MELPSFRSGLFPLAPDQKRWANIVVASLPEAGKSEVAKTLQAFIKDFCTIQPDTAMNVESNFATAIMVALKSLSHNIESTTQTVTAVDSPPLDCSGCTRIWHWGLLDGDLAEPVALINRAEKFDAVILLHGTTDNEAFLSHLKGRRSPVFFHVTTNIGNTEDFFRYIGNTTGEPKVYTAVPLLRGERSRNGIHCCLSLVSDLAEKINGVNPQSVEPQSVDPATSAFFSSVHEALQMGRVNIAVVGLPGVGKSGFAEALKVVIKAGKDIELTIVQVTDEPLQFSPCSEHINIWDLPGIDEKKAHWRLCVKVASQCDAVIFLHGTRIREVDQKVLKDLNGSEGPGAPPQIFHVRSRIDSEAKAARRRPQAGVTKEEAEGKALEEIREYIKTATGVPRAYMVCALEPDDENENDIYNWWNWDFKALARDLAEEIKAVESRRVEESGGGREVS